ncbi:adhesive plaque matrix protein-like isoform X2 [Cimex lectularius]|uniref:Uncharacterized protein n=1 Tax=Cimex lectularius TaxID=79782 RepID=A0A8I6RV66_CIMLE|nr:adhesive plaque matrix protein-like isoform X2 [Cimex lectularius]
MLNYQLVTLYIRKGLFIQQHSSLLRSRTMFEVVLTLVLLSPTIAIEKDKAFASIERDEFLASKIAEIIASRQKIPPLKNPLLTPFFGRRDYPILIPLNVLEGDDVMSRFFFCHKKRKNSHTGEVAPTKKPQYSEDDHDTEHNEPGYVDIDDHPTTHKPYYEHHTTHSEPYEHPTTYKPHYEHPTTHSEHYEHPTTHSEYYEHPTTHKPYYEHPTTHSEHYEQPTTHKPYYEHSTTNSEHYEHPTTHKPYYEHPTTHSEHYEHPTTYKPHYEHPTTHSEHYEHPTTHSEYYEHPITSSQHNEHSTTESENYEHHPTYKPHYEHPTTNDEHDEHPTTINTNYSTKPTQKPVVKKPSRPFWWSIFTTPKPQVLRTSKRASTKPVREPEETKTTKD